MEKPEISKRISMNINWRLPQHIIEAIMSELPIVNLPACRLVCKAWNDLVLNHAWTNYKIIPNTFFFGTSNIAEMHCIDLDPKHLGAGRMSSVASVGFQGGDWSHININNSCNGLLYILKFSYENSCEGILNPMTNEYIKIPDDSMTDRIYGFGFSPKTKRYKMARAFFDIKKSCSIFEIFTFITNQWSCVHSMSSFHLCRGVAYFNGGLFWIGIDKQNQNNGYVICRLDVENEKIETISLSEVGPCRQASIQAFNGSVYATFFFMYSCYKIEVWMMQSYGSEYTWIKDFVINDIPGCWMVEYGLTIFFTLIKAYEDGEILCHVNSYYFVLYNRKTGRIKTLSSNKILISVSQVETLNFGSLQKILIGDDD